MKLNYILLMVLLLGSSNCAFNRQVNLSKTKALELRLEARVVDRFSAEDAVIDEALFPESEKQEGYGKEAWFALDDVEETLYPATMTWGTRAQAWEAVRQRRPGAMGRAHKRRTKGGKR